MGAGGFRAETVVRSGPRSTAAGPVLAGLVRGRGWCVSGPCWGCAIPGEGLPRLSEREDTMQATPFPAGHWPPPSVCGSEGGCYV